MPIGMDYNVEILDDVAKESQECCHKGKKVLVSGFLNGLDNILEKEYRLVDKMVIYSKINNFEDISLHKCYVPGFSLKDYREIYKSDDQDLIVFNNFEAVDCFFDADDSSSEEEDSEVINLSTAVFKGESCKFIGCTFGKGKAVFSNAEFLSDSTIFTECFFTGGKTKFDSCIFGDGLVDFSKTKFNKGDKSFANSSFGSGEIKFVDTDFNHGDADFSYTSYEESNISFTNAKFGSGSKNFSKSVFGKGDVDFSYVKFGNGDLFFLNSKFNDGNVYFLGATFGPGEVNFHRAKFGKGNVDFSYIIFGKGVVDFSSAKFGNGNVSFYKTEFGGGDLRFSKARFGNGNINFSRSVLGEGKKDFSNIDFNSGRVDFSEINYGPGAVDFSNSVFLEGRKNFSASTFGQGDINFNEVDFGKDYINFSNCRFTNNRLYFYLARVPSMTMQNCEFNHYVDFRVLKCDMLDLRSTIFRDIVDFRPDGVAKVEIKHLNLAEAKNAGQIYNDWKANNIKKAIIVQENTTFRQKAWQFRLLKENYHVIGQYDDEDNSYVEFKRFENKSEYAKAMKADGATFFKKVYAALKYFFKWLVYDQIGKFGTSPLRVLSSMIITFMFFTVLYYPLQEIPAFDHQIVIDKAITWGDAAYFSAYNMLIIGYEDYHPAGISGILSVIESFLGLFLMSYFTVAFVRKVLR